MAAITESALVARVRQRADMEENYFVSDLEVQTYINVGLSELHDLLIQTYGQDYYISSASFTTTSGIDTYPINDSTSAYDIAATDFYKLRGVDAKLNSDVWFTIIPFNFNERNINQQGSITNVWGLANTRYRLVGGNLVFTPSPNSSMDVKIWYIPTAQQFNSVTPATSTTTFDDINGYAEYVIIDAAIKCLQKEESDVSVLIAQKTAMKRRIEVAASNRDAGSPLSVSDVYRANNPFWYSRST